jgi:hypothetical protein
VVEIPQFSMDNGNAVSAEGFVSLEEALDGVAARAITVMSKSVAVTQVNRMRWTSQ